MPHLASPLLTIDLRHFAHNYLFAHLPLVGRYQLRLRKQPRYLLLFFVTQIREVYAVRHIFWYMYGLGLISKQS
ncbi:hypothetical protein D3C85_1605500 [compost metagenome]